MSKKKTTAPFVGTFIGTGKGFGFVKSENTGADDIFIPPHFLSGALHGDTVEVKPEADIKTAQTARRAESPPARSTPRGRRRGKEPPPADPEATPRQLGRITQILKRGAYVGTFYTVGAQGYVKPIEPKIPYIFAVPPKSRVRFGLADGHHVVFSVDKKSRPEDSPASAFITEVLGHENDPGVDVLTLVRQADIPYEWPTEAREAAAAAPTEVLPHEWQNAEASTPDAPSQSPLTSPTRLDFRAQRICTIDGDDTKDIDDAISLEMTPDGHFRLGVHIADVTHYVAEASPLDREALRRGTSVYLADRVIPMLPHNLSSGICSLFPDVDRLALSCLMTVDKQGQVLDYEIQETIINSKRRWTYDEVEALLSETAQHGPSSNLPLCIPPDTAPWLSFFQHLDRLREILYEKRRARGALDFDLPEAKIRVDENGRPVSIAPVPRNRATGIIEECMILCNETIASHCLENKIPLPYRTHEAPNAHNLAALARTAANYGIKTPALAAKPKPLQKVLAAVADTPASYAVSAAVLRALPQAHYTPDNPCHYGLASEAYCHFTSPIRRYADLQTHRIIKWFLHQNKSADTTATPQNAAHFKQLLPAVCIQASRTERTAETLEREVAQLKKVQFMQGYEGETFAARVSGIVAWGVFVMLPGTVEGLIPIDNLRRIGLRYDKTRNAFVSKRNREALTPGTELEVRLVSADVEARKLTFGL